MSEYYETESIKSIKEFIHDTKREMVLAFKLGYMFRYIKLKSNLKEAQQQLDGLEWIEGAEAFYAGL